MNRKGTSQVTDGHTIDIISHSIDETQRLGEQLGKLARAGDVLCLEGDLGSGKTCFTQGLGRGLGVVEAIHSPTFILANEHRSGRLPLYHIDVYRMRGADEAIGIGLDDYVYGDGVCVIEWAEKIDVVLPAERLWIKFRHIDETQRDLTLHATGARYEELLDKIKRSL